jgi:hypothetical protein
LEHALHKPIGFVAVRIGLAKHGTGGDHEGCALT